MPEIFLFRSSLLRRFGIEGRNMACVSAAAARRRRRRSCTVRKDGSKQQQVLYYVLVKVEIAPAVAKNDELRSVK